MKLLYSTKKNNIIFGKFENLLNSVKMFSDIKIGLESKNNFEEIIPFVNIAYTNDFVVGIQPYHTSSESLRIFQKNQSKYKNFNCFLLYYSNMKHCVLRSSQNSEIYNEIGMHKYSYKYYNWYERNLHNKLRFNSINDINDTKKVEKLIYGIRNGYNVKVKFSLNGVNYILTPTIDYFNFDGDFNSLSIKTHPFIDISENEKNQSYLVKECLININGDISILQSKEYFLTLKKSTVEKIFNFFFKKIKYKITTNKKKYIKNSKFS